MVFSAAKAGWHMNNVRRLRDRSEISGTTPLRLAVAAALAYPDGSMTASGLRREAARGRLAIERTAGKDYTTLAAIEEMRVLCRVQKKAQGSGFGPRSETLMARSASTPCGSFETDHARLARAALQRIARAPSGRLATISPKNIDPAVHAVVIRPKF
jgi:hypothetical protein